MTRHFNSPRAWAFTVLGLNHYLERFKGDRAAADLRLSLAHRLVDLHNQAADSSWPWFEDVLAYDNARLSQALLVTGHALQDADLMRIGTRSLQWLARIQRGEQGHFVPIGNHGFYHRHGRRARFDQQPIEAQAMVDACIDAWQCAGEPEWLTEARRAFQWFTGDNDLRLSLVNLDTGGCHDGLRPDHVNGNMGAESTLAYLLSLAQMRALDTAPLPEAKVILPRSSPLEIHHRERIANVG